MGPTFVGVSNFAAFNSLMLYCDLKFLGCWFWNFVIVINENVGCLGFLALREIHFEALDHPSYVLVREFV